MLYICNMKYKININTRFPFGKYKGYSFDSVVRYHIFYLRYCLDNEIIELSPAAKSEYDRRLSKCSRYTPDDDDEWEMSFCMGLGGGAQGWD